MWHTRLIILLMLVVFRRGYCWSVNLLCFSAVAVVIPNLAVRVTALYKKWQFTKMINCFHSWQRTSLFCSCYRLWLYMETYWLQLIRSGNFSNGERNVLLQTVCFHVPYRRIALLSRSRLRRQLTIFPAFPWGTDVIFANLLVKNIRDLRARHYVYANSGRYYINCIAYLAFKGKYPVRTKIRLSLIHI